LSHLRRLLIVLLIMSAAFLSTISYVDSKHLYTTTVFTITKTSFSQIQYITSTSTITSAHIQNAYIDYPANYWDLDYDYGVLNNLIP